MAQAKVISLNPADYVRGGLIQDIDVAVTRARWTEWDFNGTITPPSLAACLEFEPLDGGEVHEEYLSAGKLDFFAPNQENDGKTLVSQGKDHMTQGTKWHLFIQSMADNGADLTVLNAGDISVIEGAKVHIVRKPAPPRPGMAKRDKEEMMLVVDKVISLPWDKKGAGARRTTAAKPGAASAKADAKPDARVDAKPEADTGGGDSDYDAIALGAVTEVLSRKGTAMAINSLRVNTYRELSNDKSLDKAARDTINRSVNPDWLAANGFVVDGMEVSLPE